ncbi:MAG: hypothetical protein CBC57_03605 [Euryarchaeota archaeon TMED97]|nr:MAG: hypothetical protein CBC57_03605 [Euryarchaeota archaeon TMED97]|tara:strand:- start:5565 stop:5852 length:288 start_codon:yes stop_codon:yes gene_type:complete
MGIAAIKKRKNYKGLGTDFMPTKEQLKWDKYCIENDIRISPWPVSQGLNPEEWRVAVSLGSDYKTIYKTPNTYFADEIWQEVYKTKKYYYDKHTK